MISHEHVLAKVAFRFLFSHRSFVGSMHVRRLSFVLWMHSKNVKLEEERGAFINHYTPLALQQPLVVVVVVVVGWMKKTNRVWTVNLWPTYFSSACRKRCLYCHETWVGWGQYLWSNMVLRILFLFSPVFHRLSRLLLHWFRIGYSLWGIISLLLNSRPIHPVLFGGLNLCL